MNNEVNVEWSSYQPLALLHFVRTEIQQTSCYHYIQTCPPLWCTVSLIHTLSDSTLQVRTLLSLGRNLCQDSNYRTLASRLSYRNFERFIATHLRNALHRSMSRSLREMQARNPVAVSLHLRQVSCDAPRKFHHLASLYKRHGRQRLRGGYLRL